MRDEADDFLSNTRSHDGVAGETLSDVILVERLCAFREDCKTIEFDVSKLGDPFGIKSPEDTGAEKDLEAMCKPPGLPPAPAVASPVPAPPNPGRHGDVP